MAKKCIDILKNSSEQLHKFLEAKAGVYVEDSQVSKDAWRKAAKELQNETLNNLNDIYADLKIGDYKKVAAQEQQAGGKIEVLAEFGKDGNESVVSLSDAIKGQLSMESGGKDKPFGVNIWTDTDGNIKYVGNNAERSKGLIQSTFAFDINGKLLHEKSIINDSNPELVKAVEEAIGKPVSSVDEKNIDKKIKDYDYEDIDNIIPDDADYLKYNKIANELDSETYNKIGRGVRKSLKDAHFTESDYGAAIGFVYSKITEGKPVSSVEGGEVRGQTKMLDKPIKVYHGTNEDNFKSINEKGLIIDSDGRNNLSADGSYGVSFSEDRNVTGKENTGDEKRDREEGEADISRAAQAEARLKTAKSNYDKAAKQLNAAEEKISNKQTTQGSLLRSEGAQGQMFGLDRDEAKSILDPLRQKVRETKAELDAAQKEFIAATDQQLNLFDISNSSLQAGDTKTIGDYVTAAKSVLENLYPNAKLEVFNTNEEYEKAGGEKGTRGFAIMGKEGKHRILLNLEQISKDKSGKTAIHEIIHPIVYDAFGIDSDKLNEAWRDMSVVMKDVPGMEIVFAHVANYPASKAAPEGITELLTQIVTGNINIENVPKEKKSKILEILNKILEFFGIDFRFGSPQDFATLAQKIKQSFDTSNPESLREVVKQKGIDKFIQEYERLTEKDISGRDKIINDFIKEELAAGESIDDIKSALIDNGISEQEAQSFIEAAQRSAARNLKIRVTAAQLEAQAQAEQVKRSRLTAKFKAWKPVTKDKTIVQDVKQTHEKRTGNTLLDQDYEREQIDKAASDLSIDLLVQETRDELQAGYLNFLTDLMLGDEINNVTQQGISQSLLWRQGLANHVINNLTVLDKQLATVASNNMMMRRAMGGKDDISDTQNDEIQSALGDEGTAIKTMQQNLDAARENNNIPDEIQEQAADINAEEIEQEIKEEQAEIVPPKPKAKKSIFSKRDKKIDKAKFQAKADLLKTELSKQSGDSFLSSIIDKINKIAEQC